MREILPGVFVVPQNGNKGFGYSHFVKRPGGNLILDTMRNTSLSDAFEAIEADGSVSLAVISDRHLGGVSTNQIAERFGATVYCSAIEAAAMGHRANQVRIDHALPLERVVVETGEQLIPTPGHTAGPVLDAGRRRRQARALHRGLRLPAGRRLAAGQSQPQEDAEELRGAARP